MHRVRYLAAGLLALAFWASALLAGPAVKGDRQYQEHQKIVLTADGVGKGVQVLWDVSGDPDVEEGDGKLYVWAKPGKSAVVMTAIDFDSKKVTRARFAFEVVPLVPPKPPDPPTPVDPLTATLQKAYALDADADRAVSLAFLAAVYKGMAAQAPARAEKTNVAFVTWMKSVVEAPASGLKSTQVKNLRTVIGAELSAAWGASAAPLAPTDAAAVLNRIAIALAGVR